MSNIDVVKKYLAGERPYLTISYHQSEREKQRVEGEEWTIDGKKYKKVDGKHICLTKSQGDIIREAIGDTFNCKICNANWKLVNRIDQKFLSRTGLCQDCLIEYETKLRVLGIFHDYEIYRIASYELSSLKEDKIRLMEVVKYFKDNNGDIINYAESEYDNNIVWKNTNKDKILADATKDLERVNELLKIGVSATKQFKKTYRDGLKKYKLPDIISDRDKLKS
jgi:hypothetical protein